MLYSYHSIKLISQYVDHEILADFLVTVFNRKIFFDADFKNNWDASTNTHGAHFIMGEEGRVKKYTIQWLVNYNYNALNASWAPLLDPIFDCPPPSLHHAAHLCHAKKDCMQRL